MIEDDLIQELKTKGIFSEYLPSEFNVFSNNFNVYGAGASHKDRIEPYSYYMSRFNKKGDKRLISIPEFATYVSLVNFLYDNKFSILRTIVNQSKEDENSFSRFVNSEGNIVYEKDGYGGGAKFVLERGAESNEYEKARSTYVNNMIYKIQRTKGAAGILHIDISEFYSNIYTHIFGCIKLGIDGIKSAFIQDSTDQDYLLYKKLDDRVRRLNGARTNGVLVGPYISRILSETILAVVDKELRDNNLIFTRYADDYEIAIYHDTFYEDVLHLVTSVFDKYFLKLNSEKTYYEEYPYYLFSNYEKIIERIRGSEEKMDSPEIVELFNCFFSMEKKGEKGAVRYLLSAYPDNYIINDKNLYCDYLINVICNDEKNMPLASKIFVKEYKNSNIAIDDNIKKILYKHLKYNINNGNNLDVVWLVYLLTKIGYEFNGQQVEKLLDTKNDLAIVILLEEQTDIFSEQIVDKCCRVSECWLLFYQFALHYDSKRNIFFQKFNMIHNKNFYEKLFHNGFSFYKRNSD